jgi:CRISPR-associated protein Cmr3
MTDRLATPNRFQGALATVTLTLEPLDVLFFGDGRPFEPAVRATGRQPTPRTLTGAVRTWLLRHAGADLPALAQALRDDVAFADAAAAQGPDVERIGRIGLRGPFFVLDGERLTPMPATVQRSVEDPPRLFRQDPLLERLPGWTPPAPLAPDLAPLWTRARSRAKRCGGFLRPQGLRRFLSGDVPRDGDVVRTDALFGQEERIGIGLDPALRTAAEGLIYQVQMLRLRPGVSLAVDLVGDPADLAACPEREDVLPLGGEGRHAVVRRAATGRPACERSAPSDADGTLVLLSTPGLFDGWKPPNLEPIAAAVPGSLPVSGWDLARRGPKPTRFAVPAGSVYFVESSPHLEPENGTLCVGEDAAAGWGAYHLGEWNHV